MIKKVIGKNSKLKRKSKHEAFTKEKIKNSTEKIGFFVKITKKEDKIQRQEKKKKRNELTNIKIIILVFLHRTDYVTFFY